MPFSFEGRRRLAQAKSSLNQLAKTANALITFDNDRMGSLVLPKQGIQEAFSEADKIISQSVRAVIQLVTKPGLISIGMDDLITALDNDDSRCLFGYGQSTGENRAQEALAKALKSPLLDKGEMLNEAQNVLVHICGGDSMTLFEVELLMKSLEKEVAENAQILFGVGSDPKLGDKLSVTVISSMGKQVPPTAEDDSPGEKDSGEKPDAKDAPVAAASPQALQSSQSEVKPEFTSKTPGQSEKEQDEKAGETEKAAGKGWLSDIKVVPDSARDPAAAILHQVFVPRFPGQKAPHPLAGEASVGEESTETPPASPGSLKENIKSLIDDDIEEEDEDTVDELDAEDDDDLDLIGDLGLDDDELDRLVAESASIGLDDEDEEAQGEEEIDETEVSAEADSPTPPSLSLLEDDDLDDNDQVEEEVSETAEPTEVAEELTGDTEADIGDEFEDDLDDLDEDEQDEDEVSEEPPPLQLQEEELQEEEVQEETHEAVAEAGDLDAISEGDDDEFLDGGDDDGFESFDDEDEFEEDDDFEQGQFGGDVEEVEDDEEAVTAEEVNDDGLFDDDDLDEEDEFEEEDSGDEAFFDDEEGADLGAGPEEEAEDQPSVVHEPVRPSKADELLKRVGLRRAEKPAAAPAIAAEQVTPQAAPPKKGKGKLPFAWAKPGVSATPAPASTPASEEPKPAGEGEMRRPTQLPQRRRQVPPPESQESESPAKPAVSDSPFIPKGFVKKGIRPQGDSPRKTLPSKPVPLKLGKSQEPDVPVSDIEPDSMDDDFLEDDEFDEDAADATSEAPPEQQTFDSSLEPPQKGRFDKGEPTVEDGEDLDLPTFLRRKKK